MVYTTYHEINYPKQNVWYFFEIINIVAIKAKYWTSKKNPVIENFYEIIEDAITFKYFLCVGILYSEVILK